MQLGGTQIMCKNGVSHITAGSDLEGAKQITGSIPPVLVTSDPWDRDIDYTPPKGAYDPRWFIEGKSDVVSSDWLNGFFGRGGRSKKR